MCDQCSGATMAGPFFAPATPLREEKQVPRWKIGFNLKPHEFVPSGRRDHETQEEACDYSEPGKGHCGCASGSTAHIHYMRNWLKDDPNLFDSWPDFDAKGRINEYKFEMMQALGIKPQMKCGCPYTPGSGRWSHVYKNSETALHSVLADISSKKVRAKVQVGVAVIVGNDGRVLLTKRLPGKHRAGFWEYPGGKVEPSDHGSANTIKREVMEEIGCQVSVDKWLMEYTSSFPDAPTDFNLQFFECHIVSGVPRMVAVDGLVWCDPERIDVAPLMHDGVLQVTEKLRRS